MSGGLQRHVLAIVLLLALSASGPLAAADVAVGVVVDQRGPVTVLRGVVPSSLRIGAEIVPGDRVVTPAQARVKIEFVDGSVMTLGSDSEVIVKEILLGPDGQRRSAVLSLLLGILRATARFTDPSGKFEVETSAAVASVRGTSWIVEAQSDDTSVFVIEGQVEVEARESAGRVLLSEGEGVDVRPGAGAPAAARWAPARVAEVLERTNL